ncbi:hypothetical protein [Photobacterium kishitanii]|uniref:hypothetical protein n=1 Tax=Photobacterium kishitanii TaxID=318456 RepID=UPI002738293B|nr:hypothetical protein [Photobacterium kishitanii]
MVTVSRTYSAYQKKVIRSLAKLVGARAFRYEKAQNNHLKIHIEGVDKPIFTSSTPSDCKALDNFMSQVRGMIRAAEQQHPVVKKVCEAHPKQPHVCSHEKMITSIVKNMRLMAADLQDKEVEMVFEQETVDGISEHRQQVIKKAINTALGHRKGGRYLTPSVIHCIEKDISHHVDFILPTVAHYAELLSKSKIAAKSKQEAAVMQSVAPTAELDEKETLALGDVFQMPLKQDEAVAKENKQKAKTIKKLAVKKLSRMVQQHVGEDDMSMLMSLTSEQRITQAKAFTMIQIKRLLMI